MAPVLEIKGPAVGPGRIPVTQRAGELIRAGPGGPGGPPERPTQSARGPEPPVPPCPGLRSLTPALGRLEPANELSAAPGPAAPSGVGSRLTPGRGGRVARNGCRREEAGDAQRSASPPFIPSFPQCPPSASLGTLCRAQPETAPLWGTGTPRAAHPQRGHRSAPRCTFLLLLLLLPLLSALKQGSSAALCRATNSTSRFSVRPSGYLAPAVLDAPSDLSSPPAPQRPQGVRAGLDGCGGAAGGRGQPAPGRSASPGRGEPDPRGRGGRAKKSSSANCVHV